MSDQLQMFGEKTSHELTSSPSEVLAKISALLEIVKEWEGIDQALSLKQFASLGSVDQEYLSGKMLKELSPATLAKIFRQSSKSLPTLGAIDLNGNCLIHRGFTAPPRTVNEYTLSDILMPLSEIGKEYFLSQETVGNIIQWKAQEKPLQNALQREDKQTSIADSNLSKNLSE